MSTWHQRKNPLPLWHETLWTVVTDPPDEMLTVTRFGTSGDAEGYLSRIKARGEEHSYIIPPFHGELKC